METYYKPEHLPRFSEIGEGSKPLADAFFSYYGQGLRGRRADSA